MDRTIKKQNEHPATDTVFTALFEHMSEGVALHDLILDERNNPVNYRILDVNPAFEKHTGINRQNTRGKLATEVYGTSLPPYLDIFSKAAMTGESIQFETFFEPMNRHFNISITQTKKNGFATIFTDITQRKEQEDALRKSEADLLRSQQVGRMGSYHLDIRKGIWDCTPTLDEIFGTTKNPKHNVEEWMSLLHPDDREKMQNYFRDHVIGQKQPFNMEYRIIRKSDSKTIWVHGLGELEFDADGDVTVMFGIIQDITERKFIEDERSRTAHNLSTIFEINPNPLSIADLSGKMIKANKAFTLLTGFTEQEVIGKTSIELGIWISPPREKVMEPLFTTGQFNNTEVHIHTKSGEPRHLLMSGVLAEMYNQKVVIIASTDITKQLQTDRELKEKTAELDRYFHLSLDLLCIANTDGTFLRLNPAWEHVLGYSLNDLEGARFLDYVHPDDVDSTLESMNKLSSGLEVIDFVNRYRHRDGSWRYIEWRTAPYKEGIIYAVARDITSRIENENKITQLNESLQKRLTLLTHPENIEPDISFTDIFELDEIQKIQDAFAQATGVACIISDPEGNPITKPSNFSRACDMIRGTDQGRKNCENSDAAIGRQNPNGAVMQRCLSGGFLDGGTSITVGNRHIANWLIGQILDENSDIDELVKYADVIGVDRAEYTDALNKSSRMSRDRFSQVCVCLDLLAKQLSTLAYQNIKQARDISERIHIEEELRQSEKKFRDIFRNSPNPIVLIRYADQLYIEVNQSFYNLCGYTENEIIGSTIQQLNLIHDTETDSKLQHILTEKREFTSFEVVITRKNGTQRICLLSGNLIEYNGEMHILNTIHDITELREAQRALAKNREYLLSVSSLAHIGHFTVDLESNETTWTDEMYKIFGEDPLSYTPTLDTIDRQIIPEDREKLKTAIEESAKTGESRRIDFRGLRPDAEVRHCFAVLEGEGHGTLRAHGMVQDLTDLKRAEEERQKLELQVMQAQKLESLGVLAGGIAHDFNNLLTSILGNADLALCELSPASGARSYVDDIEKASHRAADLCKQMLAYSGKGRFIIQAISLNEIVEEMAHLLSISISKKVIIKYDLHRGIPAVLADATQLRQVIMNLITNASESIGDRSGVISLSTGAMDCDADYLSNITGADKELPPGQYVYLEVRDTGHGMDKETRSRIFDPFFTTKFTGRGLGLAAVLGIVRGHKGGIQVYSETGKGTIFKIIFPAHFESVQKTSNKNTDSAGWKGSGTILLADDEETIRSMGRRMLQIAGFSVITAEDGRDAVEQYKAHSDEIRLVVLDLTMPHMDGEECFRELRLINPDVKVIMTSGYNEQDIISRFVGKGLAGFVQKPYKSSDIITKIKLILEE